MIRSHAAQDCTSASINLPMLWAEAADKAPAWLLTSLSLAWVLLLLVRALKELVQAIRAPAPPEPAPCPPTAPTAPTARPSPSPR